MESHGRIISLHEDSAEVELPVATACSSCGAKSACGSAHVRLLTIPAPRNARLGDEVTLSISSEKLNRGVLVAYLLPALTTLAGAALFAAGGDGPAVLGAAAGLAAGMTGIRLISRAMPHLAQPVCLPRQNAPVAAPLHPSI